ncbi:MAG: DUF5615 family PIN-like protein [Acidimicrobiaceae bacterium]|nr:DUF5615 family PIN-like protein [Acidimicrobiaceae bacterium]
MKLLFDQNLSRRLVGVLTAEYPGSRHVTELGLDTTTDHAIWNHADEHGIMIVSKDSDFRQLAFLLGPPPKAIWMRAGNASTRDILNTLQERHSIIAEFSDVPEKALLVLPLIPHRPGPLPKPL